MRLVPTIGSGTGQIWLNNVQCLGNETSLEQCPHDGFGNHNCYHYRDIGVECIGKTFYNMHSYIHIFLLHDLSSKLLLLSLYDYILKRGYFKYACICICMYCNIINITYHIHAYIESLAGVKLCGIG